jgi:hypothetical protein
VTEGEVAPAVAVTAESLVSLPVLGAPVHPLIRRPAAATAATARSRGAREGAWWVVIVPRFPRWHDEWCLGFRLADDHILWQ